MSQYDLVVIGGGSGGVRAARVAASFGAKVAIIEEFRLGGTCVIRGCVPKKLYKYAADFSEYFEVAESFGWSVDTSFDWQKLRENKDNEITRLEKIYGRLLEGSGVETFADRGVIAGPNQVRLVNQDKVLDTKRILIATGGTPFMPEIEGIEHAITSNEAFDLEELPKSILIVGAGYIAVEFASIFNGLGSKVTLAYRGDTILRGFDQHLSEGLSEQLVANGVDLQLFTQPEKIEKATDGGFNVTMADGKKAVFGQVFYATGRSPNVKGLGLEDVGVDLNPHHEIIVDKYSKTSVSSIWAVGDVTGRAELTPVAIREGAAFAQTEFNDNPTFVDHGIIPTAVFSHPEMGTVGMTEEEAGSIYAHVNVYVSQFKPMVHSFHDTSARFMIKLITNAENDKVLGVHILGAGSGEMIQMVGIAVSMGATKSDFDRTIAVHPTAAEELVTLKEPSYQLVEGKRT